MPLKFVASFKMYNVQGAPGETLAFVIRLVDDSVPPRSKALFRTIFKYLPT